MKKQLFIPFLFIMLFAYVVGNAQNYYDKTFDFGYYDHPVAFIADSLEDVYICGWFEDANYENQRAFVLKTDSNGQELWRVTMDVPSKYFALCLTHTGNLALSGSRNNNCFLSSLDSQTGAEIWTYEEANSDDYWFATVNEVIDSSIYKLHVVKTKYGPHRLWYYLFNPLDGSYLEDNKDILNTIYGITYTSTLIDSSRVWSAGDLDEYEGWIVNENFGPGVSSYWYFSALHIAGMHKYSDNKGSVVRYFRWSDGEYYMAVLTSTLDSFEVYGNAFQIAHNNFSVTGSGKFAYGNFIITGTIDNELALWFIDHDLTFMQEKIITTNKPRVGIDVVALPSSDMILMGSEQPDGSNDATNIFLMKLDNNGLVSTEESKIADNISIYPNPASDKIYIKGNGKSLQNVNAQILNIMGSTVKTITNINRPVSISNLSSGLYIVVVYDNNKLLYRQKFIKK